MTETSKVEIKMLQQTFFLFCPLLALATIDINFSELEYLADHLLPEECRRLVAAAHFKAYMEPNSLGQAENAMPKDVSCLQLLLHWNSAEGEGKGETHEVLEHRLRQMGKHELADWLGTTVFRQLGEDLNESLDRGLRDLLNDTTTAAGPAFVPTLSAPAEVADPEEWLPFDTICLTLLIGLALGIVAVLSWATWSWCHGGLLSRVKGNLARNKLKKWRTKVRRKSEQYELLDTFSTHSESDDDKFDVRNHDTEL